MLLEILILHVCFPVSNSILEKEICMTDLGCFSITSDFVSIHRPVNVLPQPRSVIKTTFHLYTRRNYEEQQVLSSGDQKSIINSNFDPLKATKFIIHGFLESETNGTWIKRLKDAFLLDEDYNVLIVDWHPGNKLPYVQAAANTRIVGAEVALMIQRLEEITSTSRKDIHIVGHSLGAHVAGYAGERVRQLSRITALDPAEPYFQHMPTSVRLDPSDAEFVDVIHTDAKSILRLGFGMSQLIGHVDFFPNNGQNQPGCDPGKLLSITLDNLSSDVRHFITCNHMRSTELMISSIILGNILPVAYQCTSWEDFLEGKCAECGKHTEKCAIIGLRADENRFFKYEAQKPFFLKTGNNPFWIYHYQLVVKLCEFPASVRHYEGKMAVTLYGSENEVSYFENKTLHLQPGQRYQFLVTTEKNLSNIQNVGLIWFHNSSLNLLELRKPSIYVEYITVVPMNVIEKAPSNLSGRVFCSDPSVPVRPGISTEFFRDDSCLELLQKT